MRSPQHNLPATGFFGKVPVPQPRNPVSLFQQNFLTNFLTFWVNFYLVILPEYSPHLGLPMAMTDN